MKKYLNSPEQVLIALKLGKVVYEENSATHFKMVEGNICLFNEEEECLIINQRMVFSEDNFYVIEK